MGYDFFNKKHSVPSVPESKRNVPNHNKWNPEPPKMYRTGVYQKGKRVG